MAEISGGAEGGRKQGQLARVLHVHSQANAGTRNWRVAETLSRAALTSASRLSILSWQVGSANELHQYLTIVCNHPFLAKHRKRLDLYTRRKEGRDMIG